MNTGARNLNRSPRARGFSPRRKLAVILPLLEFRARKSGNRTPLPLCAQQVGNMDELADCIARRFGIARRSVWNWYVRFEQFGYDGLCVRSRRDRGVSRFFASCPAAAALVRGGLEQSQSVKAIHEKLRKELGDAAPSYGTVIGYVTRFSLTLRRRSHPQGEEVRS